jgi:virulence-associated protein VapD
MRQNTNEFYKVFNFDLEQSKLDEFYKKHNTKAYYELEKFFIKNNFTHRQGSGYLSNKKLTNVEVQNFSDDLFVKLYWLVAVAKRVDITNVGDNFNILAITKRNENIMELITEN